MQASRMLRARACGSLILLSPGCLRFGKTSGSNFVLKPGSDRVPLRTFMQVPGTGWKIAAEPFARALRSNESWQMLSVFEVPAGEYALLVPSGRTAAEANPHRLVGCRFPGPAATPRS